MVPDYRCMLKLLLEIKTNRKKDTKHGMQNDCKTKVAQLHHTKILCRGGKYSILLTHGCHQSFAALLHIAALWRLCIKREISPREIATVLNGRGPTLSADLLSIRSAWRAWGILWLLLLRFWKSLNRFEKLERKHLADSLETLDKVVACGLRAAIN